MEIQTLPKALLEGAKIIEAHVQTLPHKPGVYRMIGVQGDVLYVGKAKDLKKRVQSYTKINRLSNRLQRMVMETKTMEFVTTHTEVEALLLEANFIKKLAPKYNILLRDDKFFSYIALTHHRFPRLMKYRGAKSKEDTYFGPFASTDAVNQSLTTLHRIFRLRSCTDSYFAARKRPCLQYHIKRCTAPCVGYINESDYGASVKRTIDFLEGKTGEVQRDLAKKMTEASTAQNYERAILYRDQIRALTQLQSDQSINLPGVGNADIFGFSQQGTALCVQVFFFRAGSNYGSASLFPKHRDVLSPEDFLTSFLPLFYADKEPPREILLSHSLKNPQMIAEALSLKSPYKVKISKPSRGPKQKIVAHALKNAQEALARKLSEGQAHQKRLRELGACLGIESPLTRIEVYDNSHIQGRDQIGAMIVTGPQGLQKQAYRTFNIRSDITPGDDYGMMREVLHRRFSGHLAQKKSENPLPDLVIIDGGKGQLGTALEVFKELRITIPLLAIAKGPDRHAGKEVFYLPDREPFSLEDQPTLLFFLQRLRDEAHRFAIGTHRTKRARKITRSILDEVPGIGAARKRDLLRHFGSAEAVSKAGIEDLQTVNGISENLAQNIYNHFHE